MDALPTSPCLSMVPSHFPESHAHRCRRRKVGKLRRICEETTTDQLPKKKKRKKKLQRPFKKSMVSCKTENLFPSVSLSHVQCRKKTHRSRFLQRFRNTSPTVSDLMSLSRLFSEFLASRAPSLPLTPFSHHHHPLSASRFPLP